MEGFAEVAEMDREGLVEEIGAVAAELAEHEAEVRVKTAWLAACRKRLATL